MNSGNSKGLESRKLLLDRSGKIELKRSDKYIALSNLSMYYTWKNIKNPYKKINLKYQLRRGMKNLNCLVGHILYQIFKIILSILSKKHEIYRIDVNKKGK